MDKPSDPSPHPVSEGFPWSRLGQPKLTGKELAEKGRAALRRLRDWGAALPPTNRLERAIRMTARELEDSLPAGRVAIEAGKTVVDFHFITHAQAERPPEEVLQRMVAALSGGDAVTSDSDRRPRDIQFELEIWAAFRIGGIDVWFEEPDLVFRLGSRRIGIAVKRIWSVEQAHKRLSDAAQQIEGAGLLGFIATNVQEYVVGVEAELELAAKGRSFDIDVRRLHGQLAYLASKKHVIGLILRGTGGKAGVDTPGQPREMSLATYTQTFMFMDDSDAPAFQELFATIGEKLRQWFAVNF